VLGSTVWLTMEQVATAALDCRAFPLASSILKQVRDKFPESLRAARLMVRRPAAGAAGSSLMLMLRSVPAACVHALSSAVACRDKIVSSACRRCIMRREGTMTKRRSSYRSAWKTRQTARCF